MVFREQEIPHEEVARAVYNYGRHFVSQTLATYENYFIRKNTEDFQQFREQVHAFYPELWWYRYEKAGMTGKSSPRYSNPFPQVVLRYASPTFTFNHNIISYRQAAAAIYHMRLSIVRGTHYLPSPFVQTAEEGRELLRMMLQMFQQEWIVKYINAANAGEPIPVYVAPVTIGERTPSNKPKTLSSRPLPPEAVAQTCKNMFAGITSSNPFYSNVNKMMKVCQGFIDKCDNDRIKSVRSDISNKKYADHHAIDEVIPSPEMAFQHIVISALQKKGSAAFYKEFFKQKAQAYALRYRGQEGVGEGVFRDFIKNCLNAIKNDPSSKYDYEKVKFFMPTYPGSTRFVINPNFNAKQAKLLGYKNVKTEEDILELYRLIGQLFACSTRVDSPVPIYLSRTIIATMLHKSEHITPEMSFMYYLMDSDPDVVKSTLQLLHDPSVIEYMYINMNDHYPLVKEDAPVDVQNFISYIDKYCRYKYLYNSHERLKAFMDGFYITRDLKKHRVTVRELDKMMCGASISTSTIREWLNMDHVSWLINTNFDVQKQNQVVAWFKDILSEMGETIPLDELNAAVVREKLNSDDSSSRESDSPNRRLLRSKKRAFLHFFMKLMEFWTSYRKIDMESAHQVRFERERGLPTSHTCFRQLCLTCDDINSKAQLYSRLITAVFGVEKGIGNF
jgi:hypothetical protein